MMAKSDVTTYSHRLLSIMIPLVLIIIFQPAFSYTIDYENNWEMENIGDYELTYNVNIKDKVVN